MNKIYYSNKRIKNSKNVKNKIHNVMNLKTYFNKSKLNFNYSQNSTKK